MPGIRATFMFQCGKWGWSETVWSTDTNIASVDAAADQLADQRAKLLSPPSYLVARRISFDDPQKDGLVYMYGGDGLTGTGPESTSDIPTTALLTSWRADTYSKRSWDLRGIQDGWSINGGIFLPTAQFNTAFNAFKSKVLTGPWGMKKTTFPATINVPIVAMTNAQSGFVTLETPAATGILRGDLIGIGGGKYAMGNAGRHRVWSVSNNPTPVITIKSRYSVTGYVPNTANVYNIATTIVKFTGGDWMRIVKRNTGRAPFLPVGRR